MTESRPRHSDRVPSLPPDQPEEQLVVPVPVPAPVLRDTTLAVSPPQTPSLPWWKTYYIPSGICFLVGPGSGTLPLPRPTGNSHLDVAVKGRLYSIPVLRTGITIGVPCIYVGASGPGIGLDLSCTPAKLVSLDIGYFYPGRVQAGIGLTSFLP